MSAENLPALFRICLSLHPLNFHGYWCTSCVKSCLLKTVCWIILSVSLQLNTVSSWPALWPACRGLRVGEGMEMTMVVMVRAAVCMWNQGCLRCNRENKRSWEEDEGGGCIQEEAENLPDTTAMPEGAEYRREQRLERERGEAVGRDCCLVERSGRVWAPAWGGEGPKVGRREEERKAER